MGRMLLWVLGLALLLVAGFAIYAVAVDPQVETKRVEKVVPNEKLGL